MTSSADFKGTQKFETQNISEFSNLAQSWLKQTGPKTLVRLEGPMGAGKTSWVRLCVEALGGKWVSSPSFAIIQRYPSSKISIDHVDLFRLKNEADLESTGFWDLFDQDSALIFVEWADRLGEDVWHKSFQNWRIQIDFVEGTTNPQARVVKILKS